MTPLNSDMENQKKNVNHLGFGFAAGKKWQMPVVNESSLSGGGQHVEVEVVVEREGALERRSRQVQIVLCSGCI